MGQTEFSPMDHCILYAYRGSIAHNLYIPPEEEMATDDRDLMGVCVAPLDYYIGIRSFEQMEIMQGADDIVIYDLRKFMRLLMKGNPNVISLLWNKPEMYLILSTEGRQLIENRNLFMTRQLFKSFSGYAYGQLKKMFSGNTAGYMGAKRKEIFNKFGYDTKNAAHLIRLLRMCCEFAETGTFNVYRTTDREELLSIKRGQVQSKMIEEMADELFEKVKQYAESSNLPESADHQKCNKLCLDIMFQYYDLHSGEKHE
jgi:predicted nucleotidyltransferase